MSSGIQRHLFAGGGYVLHNVRLPNYKSRFSAYCAEDGTMTGAEMIGTNGVSRTLNPGSPSWASLARHAKTYHPTTIERALYDKGFDEMFDKEFRAAHKK